MPRVSEGGGVSWARRFATGLSSLRDRAAARLAGSRFNPSRGETCPIPEMNGSLGPHVWRALMSNPKIERCIFCCRDRIAP